MSSVRNLLNCASKFESILNKFDVDSSDHVPDLFAKELFNIPQGVRTFFVTSSGETSTFAEPSSLSIFRFQESSEERSDVFLQVGGWTHPLVAGISPCLQTGDGAILFPDLDAEIASSKAYVGLVLLDDVPLVLHDQLVVMLKRYTAFKSLLSPEQALGTIGRILVKGAGLAVRGIERGVGKAGVLIEYVADKGQERIPKHEQDVKIGSKTKATVNSAKILTNKSVIVSGYVVERVENLTTSLAKHLAARLVTSDSTSSYVGTSSVDEKLAVGPLGKEMKAVGPLGKEMKAVGPLGKEMKAVGPLGKEMKAVGPLGKEMKAVGPMGKEMKAVGPMGKETGGSVVNHTKKRHKAMYYLNDIQNGSFLAYDTLHDGLENSGKVLGRSVRENSVKVVKHGYGDDAAEVLGDALTSAQNAAITFINLRTLVAKGLLKKGMRRKGLALAKDVAKKTSCIVRG